MATDHLTTNLARWNSAAANHDAAEVALAAVKDLPQSGIRNDIVALAAEAHDRLFRIPAPTLGALRRKLEWFWDIWAQTYGTNFKRIILGDLTRIELLLAGVHPEDASGGMNLKKVASAFREAALEYDRYLEFRRQVPSEKWGESTTSDIAARLGQAAAKVLSLPAPNLAAVEKKLAAMWVDERFDPIEATTVHVMIMRDLHRLMNEHQ